MSEESFGELVGKTIIALTFEAALTQKDISVINDLVGRLVEAEKERDRLTEELIAKNRREAREYKNWRRFEDEKNEKIKDLQQRLNWLIEQVEQGSSMLFLLRRARNDSKRQ